VNINEHPIYKAIYELCLEIEKLPGSEQQTKVVTMAGALEHPARQLIEEKDKLFSQCIEKNEWSEHLAKQICEMEDALGFKQDCMDRETGAFVPTMGPWKERVRDLIAKEGQLGDVLNERNNLRDIVLSIRDITGQGLREIRQAARRQVPAGLGYCPNCGWCHAANDECVKTRNDSEHPINKAFDDLCLAVRELTGGRPESKVMDVYRAKSAIEREVMKVLAALRAGERKQDG